MPEFELHQGGNRSRAEARHGTAWWPWIDATQERALPWGQRNPADGEIAARVAALTPDHLRLRIEEIAAAVAKLADALA